MPKSIIVKVESQVLKWLRESSGWKIEEISKRLKTTPDVVMELESGDRSPTLNQLKILSSSFKRPLASFLLSKPKEEKPLPKDYRFLSNKKDVFDKKTILAIRKSRSLQETSRDLSSNINGETKPKVERAELSDKPDLIAAKYRELFNLSWEQQRKFSDAYKLFNYLRDLLEDANILSFQFSMPIDDARGFALADESPAVVVINSKDSVEARIFTLLHEFGHVLLGETVIEIPEASLGLRDQIETWCNSFATAFLLPQEKVNKLFEENRTHLTETETLNSLSRKYKVSKAALLFRMQKMNYISRQEFESVVDRYVPKNVENKRDVKKKVRGGSQEKKRLAEVGNKFVSLVANNFDKKLITYTDALSYLSIKSKNYEKVLAKAKK